jgi:hypothetical protein
MDGQLLRNFQVSGMKHTTSIYSSTWSSPNQFLATVREYYYTLLPRYLHLHLLHYTTTIDSVRFPLNARAVCDSATSDLRHTVAAHALTHCRGKGEMKVIQTCNSSSIYTKVRSACQLSCRYNGKAFSIISILLNLVELAALFTRWRAFSSDWHEEFHGTFLRLSSSPHPPGPDNGKAARPRGLTAEPET